MADDAFKKMLKKRREEEEKRKKKDSYKWVDKEKMEEVGKSFSKRDTLKRLRDKY